MHRDTVIGIVGVVILVAAMVGVFTYERSQAGDLGGGDGAQGNFTAETLTGTVALEDVDERVVALNQTGMTNVTFALSWTATNGVDTLQLVVVAPDNTTYESDAETDGSIELVVPLNNTDASGTLGVGDWRVTVAFLEANPSTPVGPPPVDPPVPPPGTTDTSVDYTVDITGEAYGAGVDDAAA